MHVSVLIFGLCQIFASVYGAGRIYGGYPIEITKAPYTVHSQYLKENGKYVTICGGSILSENLILTAGHCTIDDETGKQLIANRYTIRVGSTYRQRGGTEHKVINVFTHPEYAGRSNYYHHDVGILQLSDEIEFNETAQPVQLASANDKICVGGDTIVSGWGINPDHPKDKNHLYQVHLRVTDAAECAAGFGDSSTEIGDHEICVQGDDKSSCQGDSGGPLLYTKTGRQIGIVSYGAGNCTIGYPNVFTKVQDNLDFINKIKKQTENKSEGDKQTVQC